MKKILLLALVFTTLQTFAQDSTKLKPKQWLGILTLEEKYKDDKNWGKEDEAIVGAHFQRLVKMNKEGVVLLAGRTQLESNDPDMMGLVIFYAKDEKEAEAFMMSDPAVKSKIMKAKILPYGIAVGACK
jgi:uncharacterized protein YciI